jgi:hypothetical protein
MTAAELIAELQKLPPDARLYTYDSEWAELDPVVSVLPVKYNINKEDINRDGTFVKGCSVYEDYGGPFDDNQVTVEVLTIK